MTDHTFGPTPTSSPDHQISAQGMIFEVIYFFENEIGDGGYFTAVGMSHDTPKPPAWILETKATGYKQRISISDLQDASDIPHSSTSGPPKTSCSFVYLGAAS